MTQENGLAAAMPPAHTMNGLPGVSGSFTPEGAQEVLAALAEPFEPQLVEWRVTNTSRGKHGLRGQVVAYADPRAYTDRLNGLFTPLGWTREYTVQAVQNFEMPQKGDGKSTLITAKVLLTCKVTIHGLGTHAGTGEEWATDENALTRAEAQAFKRACSCFGLGRYFYNFPRVWVDLDEQKRPLELPKLPDWAMPQKGRSNGRPERKAADRANGKRPENGNGRRKTGIYGEELLAALRALSEEAGFSLTRDVVRRVAGKERIDEIRDVAQLTSVLEKLEDRARGVRRLKAAVEKSGAAAYGKVCQELNLASDAIDDIPNREVLRQLVDRMEAAAAGGNGSHGNATEDGSPFAASGSASETGGIAQLRERLLIEARRVSAKLSKGIGAVIATASNGAFRFGDLAKLTERDCGKVEAALAELARMNV
jgi:predicted flap endonuclease-1-like 5' DNA nuclease